MLNFKTHFSILLFLLFASLSFAQLQTLQLEKGRPSPQAQISDVDWIAGYWRGEGFGGITEEVWTAPLGNSMMGIFKLVNEEKTNFYELIIITEEEESLVLKLKHFHADLRGWEEKEEYLEAKLVKLEDRKAYFEGFTYERIDKENLNIYVLLGEGEEVSEVKLSFKHISPNK